MNALKNSGLPGDLVDIVGEYYDFAWINPNQEAIKYLTQYFCKNVSTMIVDYEPKFCLEFSDNDSHSNRVSEKQVKLYYIDIDVLQVEFVPNKKLKCRTSISYPYSFPELTIFTLNVYREKLGGGGVTDGTKDAKANANDDKRNDLYILNLSCKQCMPRVNIPSGATLITKVRKFKSEYETLCTGTIKWKIVNDNDNTMYYHVKKCVWSFHTLDYAVFYPDL